MRVYHLLSLKNAKSNIANKRIKVATYNDLNDPFELLAPDLRLRSSRLMMQGLKDDLKRTHGLLCFSAKYSNPVLWSHYADKHKGVALGFDIDPRSATKVIYSAQRINTPTIYPPSKETMEELINTKYSGWSYEKEIRRRVRLEKMSKEKELYFYPFDTKVVLREVILGSQCEETRGKIEALLNQHSYTGVRVLRARLAFRKFAVVENKFVGRITIEARKGLSV